MKKQLTKENIQMASKHNEISVHTYQKNSKKMTFSEHVINSELSYSVDGNEKQCIHLGKQFSSST